MESNLVSLTTIKTSIEELQNYSGLLGKKELQKIAKLNDELNDMSEQYITFTKNFSDLGWCVYESLDYNLVKKVNREFLNSDIESAERILLDYFKNDAKEIVHWIKKSSKEFSDRADLLQVFFENHFQGNYISSVPLGLLIIDGAVNDYTKRKGFFAEGTDLSAWDSFVGSDESLGKLKTIFTESRVKTNKEEIRLPYRNGILHGRDLNYGNEYVSCKCVALIFAVADWIRMKNTEIDRQNDFMKSQISVDMTSQIKSINHLKQFDREIQAWKKKTLIIGKDIPESGQKEEYKDYSYLNPLLEMFEFWEKRNFGKLSNCLKETDIKPQSRDKRAGKLRKIFENKNFKSFRFILIEEKTYARTEVTVKVGWEECGYLREEVLRFNCVYNSIEKDNKFAAPWRNNGEWTLIPLDIEKIF
ncbi:hypothetical protein [Streptococcus moroccensis]|uniref:Nicotinic acid mononucleotide adenylyltransferase n=1 Tax=Streptococcus moroccensis TaxID=1451356 RepID=A0ABT9YP18_9STRE|nr:hypothetical protein [Streptococcus moroccensis]MDQ0221520.1 nicotinic acid mononucleotide adenylyltransferase [Streptococcus moroccensis]